MLFTYLVIPWCYCACPATLTPALMAYREGEEGGFSGVFSVGGGAGVAALFTSGLCVLAIPCLCMLACVGILLALFVLSGLWFVCLVAVVCPLVVCGSLLSVSWGLVLLRPSLLSAWAAH